MSDADKIATDFDSLEKLRAAHLEFIRAAAELKADDTSSADEKKTDDTFSDSIRAFIDRVRATGKRLVDDKEREVGQRVLDYWSAELLSTTNVRTTDFRAPMLDDPSPGSSVQDSLSADGFMPDSAQEPDAKIQKSREVIRLSALARQWRDSGKASGYLLTGDALIEAASYRRLDADLEEFVTASESAEHAAVRAANRRKNSVIALLVVLAVIAVLTAVLALIRSHDAFLAQQSAERQREIAMAETAKAQGEKNELRSLIANNNEQLKLAESNRVKLVAALDLINRMVRDGTLQRDQLPKEIADAVTVAEPETSQLLAEFRGPEIAGYNPRFLDIDLPMPQLSNALLPFAANAGRPLHYPNYSLIINSLRRVPFFGASNYDRDQVINIGRDSSSFTFDPRLPKELQADPAWFVGNPFDRGHIVSRREIAWGPFFAVDPQEVSRRLSDVINLYTNVAPQIDIFNQRTWSDVEQWVRDRHNPSARRVTIFTGPILQSSDPTFYGAQVPQAFWKIAVSRKRETNDLVIDAFVVPQVINGEIIQTPSPFDPRAYRTSVLDIERLTGLSFAPIMLPLGDRTRPVPGEQSEGDKLAARVLELDAGTPDVRKRVAQAMVTAIREDAMSPAEQKKVVAALVQAARDTSIRTLSTTGRFNLLFVLSEVPTRKWDQEDWIDLKASARRAIGDLGQTKVGSSTQVYLDKLKISLGISPAAPQIVYPQFSAVTREQAIEISQSLKLVGWKVLAEDRVQASGKVAQVRYRPDQPADQAAAELLAADLRAAGVHGAAANAVTLIRAGTLEIWLP